MATPEVTLNVSVAQIEEALLSGVTVPDFAQEWSEPAVNVLAVFRRLQREGRIPANAPTQIAKASPRPLVSVPAQAAEPTVAALVAAAARSTSKRTQALGKRLDDLAGVLRQRLTDERKAAESKEREEREREAARAEVERLEAQLREARAKAGKRTGKHDGSAGRATAEKYAGKSPCPNCGKEISNHPVGQAAHKRHCHAA